MNYVKQAEDKLSGVFKDLPPLPPKAKETLVQVWPWIALIFGILQLFAALTLWRVASVATDLYDYANRVAVEFGGVASAYGPNAFDKTVIYAGVVILAVDAVILLMAYPHLVKRARRGWDLLFLGSLLNLVYAVVQIFTYGRGVGSFIMSLLGSAIGFYLLFQIRDMYGKKAAKAPVAPKKNA